MRIGLSGGAASVERVLDQVANAEADGFSTMWFAGASGGDPLVTIALAGRATSSIELGTSVLPTYPRHPLSMAQAAGAVAGMVGTGRFTLGVGVSHQPVVEGVWGLDYSRPAAHMRTYLETMARAWESAQPPGGPPVLVAALGPRMLDAAGRLASGTITWMANAVAVESHVAPRIAEAAAAAGRPAPRIVVGLPVAVCDEEEGREAAAAQFAVYGTLPNYQRILERGRISGPAEAAIVGDEESVARELRGLVDAGATDVWAAIFAVGEDRSASRRRTRALLKDLLSE